MCKLMDVKRQFRKMVYKTDRCERTVKRQKIKLADNLTSVTR